MKKVKFNNLGRKCKGFKHGIAKKAVCVATSAILAASMCGTAFADGYTIPTSEMDPANYQDTNERVVTAIGAHGSAVVGEYVGLSETINQSYATTGNGVSTTNYMNNPYFGIYGTDANESPDPYVSNLFYKWYLKASGQTDAANAVQHYMYNYLFTGYSGSCITADTTSVKDGVPYALYERPDVIVTKTGQTTGFNEQITAINNFKTNGSEYYRSGGDKYVGDENYKPQISEYTEVLTKGFIQSVYNAADAAQAAYDYNWTGTSQQSKVRLRYGYDNAQETAQKYEKYTIGSDLYVLSQIANGNVKRKTVAYVTSVAGTGKDAIFTIQGNLDPLTSGESSGHILEPLNATCDNLANKLNPNLEIQSNPGATTECTVDQLATADVIILTKADNMAYNGMGTDTYEGVERGKTVYGDADQGENSTRAYGGSAEGHYKNQFYGPQTVTNNLVSTIKSALSAGGYTEKANQSILSCLMENASNCDGGSVDSMALHGVLQGFAYPELMNSLEQYGWFLNNISHIKTSQVNKMVGILASDLTLANGNSMSNLDYTGTTSDTLLEQYNQGLWYYQANKATIDEAYPQLTPSSRLTISAAPSKTELAATIASANALKQTDYTEESWAYLSSALVNANAVNSDAAATQSHIETANTALQNAISSLIKVEPTPTPEPVVETQSVYRLYHPVFSEHLYTTSEKEYNDLVAEGWQQEDVSWTSPKEGVGVYRLYNEGLGGQNKMSHHYTTSKEEADTLVNEQGWVYDNGGEPIFYSAQDAETGEVLDGATDVFRLYNDGLSAHLFTMDSNERDENVKNNGWVSEDTGFYAYAVEKTEE